jgi:hypothetical protein
MCKKVAFIGCSKKKRSSPCEAREMYRGSLFLKSLEYCMREGFLVYILSAEYGLLEPSTIITPYEKTMNKMTQQEKKEWSMRVLSRVKENKIEGDFHFFCGKNYHQYFEGVKVFEGLKGIGYQLHYINTLINKSKNAKK